MGELDPLLINFLKLDGSNADQNIDIGAWDFITTGDLFASNLTLTNNLTVNGDILANDTLFFSEDTTYIKRSAIIPIRWQFVTNRNMQWSADDIDMVATGDMTVTSDGDTTFSSTAGNIVFQANGAGNSIDFSSENGSVTVNSAMADTDILLYNTNKLLMSIIGDVDGINFFDDVSITGSVSSTNYISDVATGTSPYACTSTTLNTNLNADMLDGKHVGTSGNTIPLLDGVNDWSGVQEFQTNVKLQFRDTGIFIHSNVDGELTVEADTLLTLGVAGDTELGDGTERDIKPNTTLKINLGNVSKQFNDAHIGGDMIFYNDGGGLCFGSCSGYEMGWVQALAQNTWYNVSDAGFIDGSFNNVTHDGSGELSVVTSGIYKVNVSLDFEADAANKHVEIGFEVSNSGSAETEGIVCSETKFANEEHCISTTALLDLPAGATVELCIRTTDAGNPTVTVDCVNLNCVQIGGT